MQQENWWQIATNFRLLILPADYLDPEEICERFDHMLTALKKINPGARIIFTVSPVRHWKDGAVNNQLSKSILLLSIHRLMKKHSTISYFPAYEIFMDELRDYRFYAADMLHPSETGSSYVWERFCDSWLDEASKKIMAGVTAILKAVAHRPGQTDLPNLKKFSENLLKQIDQLTLSNPNLDFSPEIAILRERTVMKAIAGQLMLQINDRNYTQLVNVCRI